MTSNLIKTTIILILIALVLLVVEANDNLKKIENQIKELQTPVMEPAIEPIESIEPITKDQHLLAKLIHTEANSESLEGQIAVGAVVMNRVNSSDFPNTIHEVIFAKGQFCGAKNIDQVEPTETNLQAAKLALQGQDPTGGAIYFYNPETAECQWIRTRPIQMKIKDHVFAR